MKTFFRSILFGLFFVSITLLMLVFPLKKFIISSDYLKKEITKNDLYRVLYDSSPEIAETVIKSNNPKGSETDRLTATQMVSIVKHATTPDQLKEKTEGFIDQFYNWLENPTGQPLTVNLTDLKPKIESQMAKELNIPLVFVSSGSIGLAVPDEYRISLPSWLYLLHILRAYYWLLISGLALTYILTVSGFSWLKGPRNSDKLKSFGFSQILLGTIGILSTLGYWLFFRGENIISSAVANWFEVPVENAAAFYRFFNEIFSGYVKSVTLAAIVILAVGILTRVLSVYVRKFEVKKFQEGQRLKNAKADNI